MGLEYSIEELTEEKYDKIMKEILGKIKKVIIREMNENFRAEDRYECSIHLMVGALGDIIGHMNDQEEKIYILEKVIKNLTEMVIKKH